MVKSFRKSIAFILTLAMTTTLFASFAINQTFAVNPPYQNSSILVGVTPNPPQSADETPEQYSVRTTQYQINLTSTFNSVAGFSSYTAYSNANTDTSDAYIITLNDCLRSTLLTAIQKLNSYSVVVYAEPNYHYEADLKFTGKDDLIRQARVTPNDQYYCYSTKQAYAIPLQINSAWYDTVGDDSVVVGVIDTGIDFNHPDLQGRQWVNLLENPGDTTDNDGNGYINDINGWDFYNNTQLPSSYSITTNDGHGTEVAGLMAANGNNSIGIAGVTWNIKLADLKVSDSFGTINEAAIIAAIQYATAKKIPILCCGFAGDTYSVSMYNAIKSYPGLFVAAAGDNASEQPCYPAAYPLDNIISVTSTNYTQNPPYEANTFSADISNYGRQWVDITAPGGTAFSTILPTVPNPTPYDYYGDLSTSTSYAAAIIAGTAALTISRNIEVRSSLGVIHKVYTGMQLKQIIMRRSDKFDGLKNLCLSGGLVNTYKSLNNASGGFEFNATTQTITGYSGANGYVQIPSEIDGIAVKNIAESAFAGNSELNWVVIPSSIENIGAYAFFGCKNLGGFNVDANNPYYASFNDVLFNKDRTTLIQFPQAYYSQSYVIPNGTTLLTEYAFSGNSKLTTLTMPSTLTSLPNYAFAFCSNLTSVTFPSTMTQIGNFAFTSCISLGSGGNNIVLPASLNTIGDNAFLGCFSITTLTVNSTSLSIGKKAFYNCSNLANININGGVSLIDSNAFQKCTSLQKFVIPYNANCNTEIKAGAFIECYGLTTIGLSSSVTLINRNAPVFSAIPNYTHIYAPSGSEGYSYAIFINIVPDVRTNAQIAAL